MQYGNMPSISVCIIKDNEILWSKGYGRYNQKYKNNPTNDSIYMLGSITKTITATALMQLYEKNLYRLDDDINDYLPFSIRNPKYPEIPITIRMLFAHQSSLLDHRIGLIKELKLFVKTQKKLIDPFSIIKKILIPGGEQYEKKLWMDYPPGSNASYSSLGYVILSYIFKIIYDQSIEEYCYDKIFEPLNMENTSFILNDLNNKKIAIPYARFAGLYFPLPNYDFGFLKPAGGLRSTVNDLSKILIAHMNNGKYEKIQLLKKNTVDLMHSLQYPDGVYRKMRFGIGWILWMKENNEIFGGNAGANLGYYNNMRVRLSDSVAIIFFTNQNKGIIYPREKWVYNMLTNMFFFKADQLISEI